MKAKVHVGTSTWKNAKYLEGHDNMQTEMRKKWGSGVCSRKKFLRSHPLVHRKTPF